MQKYAIINTCGREDCCSREKDPYGGYYLAADVDARIAELRQAFTRYGRHTDPCLDSGHRACICGYAEAFKSLMVTE